MKTAPVHDKPLPPQVPNNFVVVLRSVCVGIATTVVAVCLAMITLGLAVRSVANPQINFEPGGAEVGWDLVTLWHNVPPYWRILPIATFTAGFVFGFRYFSRAHT